MPIRMIRFTAGALAVACAGLVFAAPPAKPSIIGPRGLQVSPTAAAESEPQDPSSSRHVVRVSAKAARQEVLAGSDLPIVIVFDIQPSWHIWPHDKQDAIPTTIAVATKPSGVQVHEKFAAWPRTKPALIAAGPEAEFHQAHDGRTIVSLPVSIAADAAPGPAKIEFSVDFQACDDKQCRSPATVTVPLAFTIVPAGTATSAGAADPDFQSFPGDVFARIHAGEKAPALVPFRFFR